VRYLLRKEDPLILLCPMWYGSDGLGGTLCLASKLN